jgi:hypothetical protein
MARASIRDGSSAAGGATDVPRGLRSRENQPREGYPELTRDVGVVTSITTLQTGIARHVGDDGVRRRDGAAIYATYDVAHAAIVAFDGSA